MLAKRIIFIILTILWMLVVFWFSHQPADESSNTSSIVTKKIISVIYGKKLTEQEVNVKLEKLQPIVRKMAHYTLYLIGGVIISGAIFTYEKNIRQKIIITQGIGSAYAVTDEIHQYFVVGRSCQITDVLIDSCGIFTGIMLVLILAKIYSIIKEYIKERKVSI